MSAKYPTLNNHCLLAVKSKNSILEKKQLYQLTTHSHEGFSPGSTELWYAGKSAFLFITHNVKKYLSTTILQRSFTSHKSGDF
jgi:hypothetical protein